MTTWSWTSNVLADGIYKPAEGQTTRRLYLYWYRIASHLHWARVGTWFVNASVAPIDPAEAGEPALADHM
jgi:hypothetical protein